MFYSHRIHVWYSWYPKQQLFSGCLVKQPFFYVMTWNHPVETTIKKMVVWSSRYLPTFYHQKLYPNVRIDKFASVWDWSLRFNPTTLGIQSPCQMMIKVSNHLLRKVFRFHYHSQKVIGSLGKHTHPGYRGVTGGRFRRPPGGV